MAIKVTNDLLTSVCFNACRTGRLTGWPVERPARCSARRLFNSMLGMVVRSVMILMLPNRTPMARQPILAAISVGRASPPTSPMMPNICFHAEAIDRSSGVRNISGNRADQLTIVKLNMVS